MELRTNDKEGATLHKFLCVTEEQLDVISSKNNKDLQAYVKRFMEDHLVKKKRDGTEEALLLKKFVANCNTIEEVVLVTTNFMDVVRKSLNRFKSLLALDGATGNKLTELIKEVLDEIEEEDKVGDSAGKTVS